MGRASLGEPLPSLRDARSDIGAFMNQRRALAQRGLSAAVALLVLVPSFAVPLLERSSLVEEPVAESEHDPSACHTGHDHTICTQLGGNLSAPVGTPEHDRSHSVVRLAPPLGTGVLPARALADGHRSRAPPLG